VLQPARDFWRLNILSLTDNAQLSKSDAGVLLVRDPATVWGSRDALHREGALAIADGNLPTIPFVLKDGVGGARPAPSPDPTFQPSPSRSQVCWEKLPERGKISAPTFRSAVADLRHRSRRAVPHFGRQTSPKASRAADTAAYVVDRIASVGHQ